MPQLIIKPNAILMAKEAYDWYEQQSAGLGEAFLLELDSCYQKIENHPTNYSKVSKHFRQLGLKRFPYVIVFEVMRKEVIVYSVFHTSRNPKNKLRRK